MSRIQPRLRTAMLSAVVLLATVASMLLAIVVPAQADALPATNWPPVALSQVPGASQVITDPSGNVTVGCPQQSGSAKFVTLGVASGQITQQQNEGSLCDGTAAVGKDGTVYVYVNTASAQLVRAWRGNVLAWEYTIPCGPYGSPRQMVMGANGNLYMTIIGGSGQCSGQQLIGLNASGQLTLNAAIAGGNPLGLAAYGAGLVLYQADGIRYVGYDAKVSSPVVVPDMIAGYAGQVDGWFDASVGGRVFATSKANAAASLGCSEPNNAAASIRAIDSTGPAWTTTLDACTYVREIHPMPNGGAVVRFDRQSTIGGQMQQNVAALDTNGKTVWSQQYGVADYPNSRVVTADTNGNVVVRTNLAEWATVNGSSYRFPQVRIELRNGTTGAVMQSVALRGSSDTTDGPSYMWGDSQIAVAAGTAYVSAYQCTTFGNCNMGTTQLYALKVPGLGLDYPRGAILNYQAGNTLVYAALGDSFSSGEGVAPFEAGSDVPLSAGADQYDLCHRSTAAYPRLLAGDAKLGLTIVNEGRSLFVACSGATTAQFFGPWPEKKKDGSVGPNAKEKPQIAALNPSVKVVTLSFGGNDAGFSDFVGRCLLADCSTKATRDHFLGSKGTVTKLGASLTKTYEAVLASAPNATVYVLGYPQLLPDQGCSAPGTSGMNATVQALVGAARAWGLPTTLMATKLRQQLHYQNIDLTQAEVLRLVQTPRVTFSPSEQAIAKQLVTKLDGQIQAAVRQANAGGSRLVYIDPLAKGSPFTGKGLCTTDSYFNGLVVNPLDLGHDLSYSFHPNTKGQTAYYQLVKSRLTAPPRVTR